MLINPSFYKPPNPDNWSGRRDSLPNERLFQQVRCLSLINSEPFVADKNAYAILGFASDEGVRRNLGRIGAAQAPQAIRPMLANLATDQTLPLYDCGDITLANSDLETAQQQLSQAISYLLTQQLHPILLGGGHEIAWPHFHGLSTQYKNKSIGIINFDAHFDLRKAEHATSGTPFLQIANYCKQDQRDFHYLCIGIQPCANTASLFKTADALNVTYVLADDIYQKALADNLARIEKFIAQVDYIYLTICCDVLSAAYAPGVSAPQPLGLQPWQVINLMQPIVASGKVISFDIAELNPNFDPTKQTIALAAQFIWHYIFNKKK